MGTQSFMSLPSPTVGYEATLLAASPADLASFRTLGPITEGGYASGQVAFSASTGQLFTLVPTVGTPDGVVLLATSDDTTRQWLLSEVMAGTGCRIDITTPEVDLTQPLTIQIVPPMAFKGQAPVTPRAIITQLNGSVSTAPTLQIGSNAAINDINTSGATPAFTTQAANTLLTLATGNINPSNVIDYSLFGVRLQITVGATLGSATVFKGKFSIELTLTIF